MGARGPVKVFLTLSEWDKNRISHESVPRVNSIYHVNGVGLVKVARIEPNPTKEDQRGIQAQTLDGKEQGDMDIGQWAPSS